MSNVNSIPRLGQFGLCALVAALLMLGAMPEFPQAADRKENVRQSRLDTGVKAKAPQRKTDAKKASPSAATQAGGKQPGSVYDNQAAITDSELRSFLEVLPQFRNWCRASNESPHPAKRNGKADFAYSKQAADWVRGRGWQASRFFNVLGRLAAALVIVEEGNDLGDRPGDMPAVSRQDLELTRRHLGAILKALDKSGDTAPPINK